MICIAWKTNVKHIVQSVKDNLQDIPRSVEFELDCRGPGVMIDLYTSVNFENVMKFKIPVNEINATLNIDHFHPENTEFTIVWLMFLHMRTNSLF